MNDLRDLYQEVVIDHNRSPRNHHVLDKPDCQAEGFNPLCGDKIKVYLKFENNCVEEASFVGTGCAISTASASLMTERLKGMSVEDIKKLFKEVHGALTGNIDKDLDLGKLEVLKGVCQFPARVKCATLAWHTLRAALDKQDAIVSTE